jgi:uncharacterized protein DUF6644
MSFLRDFCVWLQDVGWATQLRESFLLFPLVEGVHLLGIAFIIGPILMLDLRLAGFAWRKEPVSKISDTFVPVAVLGAIVSLSTGVLLFCAEPLKSYESWKFWVKMTLLFTAAGNAIFFHFKTQRSQSDWDNDLVPPIGARFAGILSILLWTGVIAAGRYYAYS